MFCKTFEFGDCGLDLYPSTALFFSSTCPLLEARDVEEDTLGMAAVCSCPRSAWRQRESVRSNQSFMLSRIATVKVTIHSLNRMKEPCGLYLKWQFLGQFWSNRRVLQQQNSWHTYLGAIVLLSFLHFVHVGHLWMLLHKDNASKLLMHLFFVLPFSEDTQPCINNANTWYSWVSFWNCMLEALCGGVLDLRCSGEPSVVIIFPFISWDVIAIMQLSDGFKNTFKNYNSICIPTIAQGSVQDAMMKTIVIELSMWSCFFNSLPG